MAKILVLYYSAYGHIETMAYAVAEGAKSAGADVGRKEIQHAFAVFVLENDLRADGPAWVEAFFFFALRSH